VTADEQIQGQTFGEVAEDFDRVRHGYPEALVDDVLAYCGSALDGRYAVEVGAGTGKATRAFVARGVPVVAVEPDDAMAAILDRHVGDAVRIVRVGFEEYEPEKAFGLLYSADAWHWIRQQARWALAGRALAPGGALALFWNNAHIDDPVLRQSMLDVLAEITPSIVIDDDLITEDQLLHAWPGTELVDRPEFHDVAVRLYQSRLTMSGVDYLTLMWTRSQVRMLAEQARARLFAALADVFDGIVPLTVYTGLYLARRVPEPT
jgi:SAM-dependent methyltransferase